MTDGPATVQSRPAVVCAACKNAITTDYFQLNGKVTCAGCRSAIESAVSAPTGARPFGRAAGLGLLAAIGGAAIYYGVIALLNLEIGIVAILIGYMVGWGVRKGANGRGGRRFQVLAILLTYWAVGLAYMPIFLKAGKNEKTQATASSDSTARIASDSAASSTVTIAKTGDSAKAIAAPPRDANVDKINPTVAIVVLFFYVFALPVIVIAAGGGSGLISAFIIAIGMRQAWRMTGAPTLKISGPYRIGSSPSTAPV
ncbi:MAG: hypothetical protein M3Y30_11685 [Gemmatimonadota bacterium]|nr:hypothetical protein [Gemmatimonadota bacterium]